MSQSEKNHAILAECGGLEALLGLLSSPRAVENEYISSNATEAIANATRSYDTVIITKMLSIGARSLVLLCASKVIDVRRNCALAIGNVAQGEATRKKMGDVGAIEALFLLAEANDATSQVVYTYSVVPSCYITYMPYNTFHIYIYMQTNACWALSNLAWCPENQERIGDFFAQLLHLIGSIEIAVRTHATAVLANCLYFHEGNRRRLGRTPDAIATLCRLLCTPYPEFQAHAARALGAAAYNDVNCKLIGLVGGVEELTKICAVENADVQQYAAFALGNLAVHDNNKTILSSCGAVEALVNLNASSNSAVVRTANEALAVLANTTNQSLLVKKKDNFGVDGLIGLCNVDNALVQGLAAEALAEETWNDLKKQDAISQAKGIDALLKVLIVADSTAVIRALWALRNATYKHPGNKDSVGKKGGIRTLLRLASVSNNPEQVEAALACLTNVCIDHEMNCRYDLACISFDRYF